MTKDSIPTGGGGKRSVSPGRAGKEGDFRKRNPPFHSEPNSRLATKVVCNTNTEVTPFFLRTRRDISCSLSLARSQMNESQSHRHHAHSRPLSDCPDVKLTDLQRRRRVSSSIGISNFLWPASEAGLIHPCVAICPPLFSILSDLGSVGR